VRVNAQIRWRNSLKVWAAVWPREEPDCYAEGSEVLCRPLHGGAKAAGGQTIGILPGSNPQEANPYIDISIATGLGHVRNIVLIRSADGVIAIGGKAGTLSEIAFSMIENKPIVSLNSWDVDPSIPQAQTPSETVDLIFRFIDNGQGRS